jgi:DNA-binding NtrC family response regulator
MAIDPVTTWHATLPERPAAALVGSSAPMVRLRAALEQAATETAPVMIRGESGSGKTLAGRVFLAACALPRGVVRVRCGRDGPDEVSAKLYWLLEASARKAPAALLLDDVGDTPSWLQDRIQAAVASASTVCPPRIAATTSRDLERLVTRGALQQDFLLLTLGTTLWIPPLRVRRGDIREIVQHFLLSFPGATFEEDALEWLEAQTWPENVRQLRDVVRRLVLLHDHVTCAHIAREFGYARRKADK